MKALLATILITALSMPVQAITPPPCVMVFDDVLVNFDALNAVTVASDGRIIILFNQRRVYLDPKFTIQSVLDKLAECRINIADE